MFIDFRLELKGWCAVWRAGPGVTARTLNAMMADGFGASLRMWHQRFRHKHFTHAGASEYGYLPRKGEGGIGRWRGSYTERKLRKFGHTYPLVYSGTTRRLSAITRITTSGKGGKASYNLPTLNLRPRGGRINMRAEFQRISPREEVDMVARFRRTVEGRLVRLEQGTLGMQAGAL